MSEVPLYLQPSHHPPPTPVQQEETATHTLAPFGALSAPLLTPTPVHQEETREGGTSSTSAGNAPARAAAPAKAAPRAAAPAKAAPRVQRGTVRAGTRKA